MTNHVDVLIVGAGISGIGMAVHLQRECPAKTFRVFEQRAQLGGTWDLFRYPGVRSDSDMYTMGYEFEPWRHDETLGAGARIRGYLADVADRYGIADKIVYETRVLKADWSSAEGHWIVTYRSGDGSTHVITATLYYAASGYYDYDKGYRPDFAGEKKFKGQILHPQFWPEDVDYAGKKIVVIGSGATAITVVPAMTDKAEHVTMLQRTPTWIAPIPGRDRLAALLRRIMPEKWVYAIVRFKNTRFQRIHFKYAKTKPDKLANRLLTHARKTLGERFDAAALTPPYKPWDQRLCFIPDDDLYTAMNAGKASIVTDEIEAFDESGIRLKSGSHLDADIVVTATGLTLATAGKVEVSVDGDPVIWNQHYFFKNCMISNVPNFVMVLVYINASATLRSDLVAKYICRLIDHMDRSGARVFTPVPPANLKDDDDEPPLKLASGYVQRSLDLLPKNGDRAPWRLDHDYFADRPAFLQAPVADPGLVFSHPVAASAKVEAREAVAAE